MNYWVLKGNPKWYEWDQYLRPGQLEPWCGRVVPTDLERNDRIFLWESGSGRRLIGFGEIARPQLGKDRDGRKIFEVRYLTYRLSRMLTIHELRAIPELRSAAFLKPGPFATIYRLSQEQALAIYRVTIKYNRNVHIWRDPKKANTPQLPLDIEAESWEGNPMLTTHLRRERNPALAKLKKEQFRRKHGRLYCEACHSEHTPYGRHSDHAFEVHHRRPLGKSSGSVKTNLRDLGILCATCHRVIHRSVPMLSIAAFKRLIG